MPIKVLIISPMLPATGNTSTVYRLQNHLLKHNFLVSILCTLDLKHTLSCPVKALNDYILEFKVDVVLLLHAVKSGACLICNCINSCQLSVKYGVVFGGTDINEDIQDDKKLNVMRQCLENSVFCVAFNQSMHDIAHQIFPSVKLHQHVQTLNYNVYDARQTKVLETGQACSLINPKPFVLLLPCSIRPVKDPLFIAETIYNIRDQTKKDVRLLILGSVTDADYGEEFFEKLCNLTNQNNNLDKQAFMVKPHSIPFILGKSTCIDSLQSWFHDPIGNAIQYLPAISQEDYFRCLESGMFFAVLNTSLSEGMASSILEAMAFNIPVVARNITGNKTVIIDEKTGLLFSSSEEFVFKIIKLLNDQDFTEKIAVAAHSYVMIHHSPYAEARFYVSLLNQMFL